MMNSIKLVHHDDGKQKLQSNETHSKEKDFCDNEYGIHSYNIFDITGYGETKEEALKDFERKIKFIFDEYKKLEKLLLETNVLTNNIAEVDYAGNEIK